MKKLILSTAIMALLFSAAALAQPFDSPQIAEKLGLTDQQKDQIHTLRIKHQSDMIMRRAELKIAKLEMKEAMADSRSNDNAVYAIQDKISKMKSDMARLKLQHRLAVRKILTDEQFNTWKSMRREMGPRGGRHMRDGMRRMDCPPMMGPGGNCPKSMGIPLKGPGPDGGPATGKDIEE